MFEEIVPRRDSEGQQEDKPKGFRQR